MIDYASGSIGNGSPLDPGAINNTFHNSLGGMYQFGGTNGNMPGVHTMFGSESQMYYTSPSPAPASQAYRRPDYAMRDYGIGKYLKNEVFGSPLAIGEGRPSTDVAFKEQSSLFWANLGFDAAEVGAGSALGLAGIYAGGMAGLALGGMGFGVGAAVSTARDSYMGNYERTSDVYGITNRIMDSNGNMGLSKSDNIDIAKFLGDSAAKDPLLDIQDMSNIMNMAGSSGMLNGERSASGIKKKMKELTDTLKSIADLNNSSDLKGLMAQMKKFSMLGIGSADTKKIMTDLSMFSDQAGMSRATVANFNDRAMMSATSGTSTIGTIAGNTARSIVDTRYMQQNFVGSGSLNDDSISMSSLSKVNEVFEEYSSKMYGVSSNKKAIYAKQKASRTGRTIDDVLEEANKMDLESLSKEIRKEGNHIKDSGAKDSYQKAIGNEVLARAYVQQDQELRGKDTGDNKALFKFIGEMVSRKNGGALNNREIISELADRGLTDNLTQSELEAAINKVKMESSQTIQAKKERSSKKAKSSAEYKRTSQQLSRLGEKNNFMYKIQEDWGGIKNAGRNFIGGFNAAGNIGEMAQNKYNGSRSISLNSNNFGAETSLDQGGDGVFSIMKKIKSLNKTTKGYIEKNKISSNYEAFSFMESSSNNKDKTFNGGVMDSFGINPLETKGVNPIDFTSIGLPELGSFRFDKKKKSIKEAHYLDSFMSKDTSIIDRVVNSKAGSGTIDIDKKSSSFTDTGDLDRYSGSSTDKFGLTGLFSDDKGYREAQDMAREELSNVQNRMFDAIGPKNKSKAEDLKNSLLSSTEGVLSESEAKGYTAAIMNGSLDEYRKRIEKESNSINQDGYRLNGFKDGPAKDTIDSLNNKFINNEDIYKNDEDRSKAKEDASNIKYKKIDEIQRSFDMVTDYRTQIRNSNGDATVSRDLKDKIELERKKIMRGRSELVRQGRGSEFGALVLDNEDNVLASGIADEIREQGIASSKLGISDELYGEYAESNRKNFKDSSKGFKDGFTDLISTTKNLDDEQKGKFYGALDKASEEDYGVSKFREILSDTSIDRDTIGEMVKSYGKMKGEMEISGSKVGKHKKLFREKVLGGLSSFDEEAKIKTAEYRDMAIQSIMDSGVSGNRKDASKLFNNLSNADSSKERDEIIRKSLKDSGSSTTVGEAKRLFQGSMDNSKKEKENEAKDKRKDEVDSATVNSEKHLAIIAESFL